MSRVANKWAAVILLFLSGVTFGQGDEIYEPRYFDFVQYDKNEVVLPRADALDHFFEGLDRLAENQEDKVSIVHIGDSHIQADYFSNHIREQILSIPYFGNGGRGFVFPYTVAKTNNPINYYSTGKGRWTGARNSVNKHTSRWGLAGVTASTYDSTASFMIRLNADEKSPLTFSTNKVSVYYPTEDSTEYGVALRLTNDSLVYGVSDTLGRVTFELDSLSEEIWFELTKNGPHQNHFTLQGIFLENDDPGVVYSSLGANGAKVNSFLKCQDFIPHLASVHPDLVIISLGTNDAYNTAFNGIIFKREVEQLVFWVKQAAPESSILLTTPGDCFRRRRYINYDNAKAKNVLIQVAKEQGLAIWDFYEIMGGLQSMEKWRDFGLGKRDLIHLTDKGYILQGELLFNALIIDKYFGEYQTFVKKDSSE